MKNRSSIIIIVAAALLVLVVVIIVRQNQSRFNWYETYEIESHEPYGAFVMGEMLKNYYPGKKFTVLKNPLSETLLNNKSSEKENYVFIGNWLHYDTIEINALLSFVDNGNTVFISSTYTSLNFLHPLFPDTCVDLDEAYFTKPDSTIGVNFYSPSLRNETDYSLTYVFRNQPYQYSWGYYDSTFFCGKNNAALALGYMDAGYINFIRIHYGKGDFFLHSSPLFFSNYALTKKENLDYAARIFSYLPKGNILWDEYNKMPGDVSFNSNLRLSQSPFQYILGQESLRWAWYIMLLLVLLYILFFGKRNQRIIPIIEPNTNTSLEFVNTIGQLYYQQRNHKVLCMHKMKLFQTFIRNRYLINTIQTDDEVFKKISVKSQIPSDEVKNIFTQYNWIDRNMDITDKMLIEFNRLIENFYKNCK